MQARSQTHPPTHPPHTPTHTHTRVRAHTGRNAQGDVGVGLTQRVLVLVPQRETVPHVLFTIIMARVQPVGQRTDEGGLKKQWEL